MTRPTTPISALPLLLIALAANIPAADVVVYGGSSAGVMASVQTARMGHPVTLVAPETPIGGMPVASPGSADLNTHWFRHDDPVRALPPSVPSSPPEPVCRVAAYKKTLYNRRVAL